MEDITLWPTAKGKAYGVGWVPLEEVGAEALGGDEHTHLGWEPIVDCSGLRFRERYD